MARQKIEDPDLLQPDLNEEKNEEGVEKQPVKNATVQEEQRKVSCRVVDDVNVFIGSRHIVCKKDSNVSLDSDVAAILSHAGKLYRL